jgi:hypothetical protein
MSADMSTFKDVSTVFGADGAHGIYGVFKDFQTLLAAVIALAAAAIAFPKSSSYAGANRPYSAKTTI